MIRTHFPAQDNGAEAKYVMADWKTADANQVLGDAAAHSDVRNKDDLVTPVYSVSNGSFQQAYSHKEQAYYESMAVRLYHLHGSSLDKGNIAVEYSERTASSGESVKVFEGPGTFTDSIPRRKHKPSLIRIRMLRLAESEWHRMSASRH